MTMWQEIKAAACRFILGYWPEWVPDDCLTPAGLRKKQPRKSPEERA